MRKYFIYIPILTTLLLSIGCEPTRETKPQTLRVLATTSIIADAVSNIAGNQVQVESLMGPGVDPHLYKPSLRDVEKLTDADIIFFNGLHLEGKMQGILEKLSQQKPVVAVSNGIPSSQLHKVPQTTVYDPHIWFNVKLWQQCVQKINQVLQKQDPKHADLYQQNTILYLAKLDSLHQQTVQHIQSIPKTQRVLITAHDAFGYFGREYDIQVRGLQGISTLSEYGLQDVSSLIDYITQQRIKAVFMESSVSPRSIEAVIEGCRSRGHQVKLGGSLYADALGAPSSPAGTYEGMFRSNVNTIVNALR